MPTSNVRKKVTSCLKRSSVQFLLTDPEAEASDHEKSVDGIDAADVAANQKLVLLVPDIIASIVEARADDRVMPLIAVSP